MSILDYINGPVVILFLIIYEYVLKLQRDKNRIIMYDRANVKAIQTKKVILNLDTHGNVNEGEHDDHDGHDDGHDDEHDDHGGHYRNTNAKNVKHVTMTESEFLTKTASELNDYIILAENVFSNLKEDDYEKATTILRMKSPKELFIQEYQPYSILAFTSPRIFIFYPPQHAFVYAVKNYVYQWRHKIWAALWVIISMQLIYFMGVGLLYVGNSLKSLIFPYPIRKIVPIM
jgi:hypothetical protein